MHRRPFNLRSIPAMLFALLLPLGPMAVPAATRQHAEAQLRSLHHRIERLKQEVGRSAEERERVTAKLRETEISLGQARGALRRIESEYDLSMQHRAALQHEKTQQEQALANGRAALADTVKVAYMIGRQEPLKLLLNQRDPLASARLFAYYGYFGRSRAAQIEGIRQRLQRLDELDAELIKEQQQLAKLREAKQEELRRLDLARNERHQILVTVTGEVQTREESLARLKAQQVGLEHLLQRLTLASKPRPRSAKRSSVKPPAATPEPRTDEAPAAQTPVPEPDSGASFGRLRGTLAWPVGGHVTARYGDTRESGVRWDGVVIATEQGALVRAVSAGRVVYADWLPGLGLLTILDHGDGYLSLYGHNDQLLRRVGEEVGAGETIAVAGDTGGRASPELYFEIRRAGRPVDPGPWFRERRPVAQ